ncbi:protein PET117 [Marchantia polymorpha subsp. ruderalis]|uniref:Uncharacterized protein n=2 Tax=Marchantia polymorpha TaxID=3197 RepID=A0AAF6AN02_MARPO|nr:hypothetical protein MARPO_0036s0105 [Marchantia polymorpha]BBM97822.1 hypothetical protein Mp_1g08620 [Marchantia polymorpha subsp. ruderalis]|eukprot:PTQ41125.1 hypothetical protein MARPO_0036s0105 [Marchantia polymorpha]
MGSRTRILALLFFGVVAVGTGAGIFEVHREQKLERQALHQGVIRDQHLLALKEQQLRQDATPDR